MHEKVWEADYQNWLTVLGSIGITQSTGGICKLAHLLSQTSKGQDLMHAMATNTITPKQYVLRRQAQEVTLLEYTEAHGLGWGPYK